jgi:serine/threonine protein kinase
VDKVQGYSLSEIVATYRQRTALPSYILAVDWFEQAFRALAAIHATGRKHGSIGLEKIFVGADDEVQINEGDLRSDFARGWTPTETAGQSAGAAPEQLAGRAVDQRADLYSLGAAFYELLTLHRPDTSPDPPSSINRTVPKGFDALLLRLLAAAPEDRYASAEEVLADLAALRRSSKSMRAPSLVAAASQAVRPAGVPRAAMIAAGSIIGAVGGAIAGYFLNSFLPATIVVGAVVGGVVGIFANPNA